MSFVSGLRELLTQQLRSNMAHQEHMTVLVFPSVIVGDDTPGVTPASKAAIAAMPVVEEELDGECAICLTEYGSGEEVVVVVKEMPCKHRYHSGCIEKWLGIHGSCPVCRYEMPVDKEEEKNIGRRGTLVINFVMGQFGLRPDSVDQRSTGSVDGH